MDEIRPGMYLEVNIIEDDYETYAILKVDEVEDMGNCVKATGIAVSRLYLQGDVKHYGVNRETFVYYNGGPVEEVSKADYDNMISDFRNWFARVNKTI